MNKAQHERFNDFLQLLTEAPCYCSEEVVCLNCQLIDDGFKTDREHCFKGME